MKRQRIAKHMRSPMCSLLDKVKLIVYERISFCKTRAKSTKHSNTARLVGLAECMQKSHKDETVGSQVLVGDAFLDSL